MLDELHVENLALIKQADFVPDSGLTVLTGETGAGKTALLSALKLLMGERADSSMVREGESAALVVGRMFRGSRDGEGFTVRRRVGSDGRSRVKIDGSIASVRELSTSVGPLIDLCGQHEHQRLYDPAMHVGMVDAWAGAAADKALDSYRERLHDARQARKAYERVMSDSKAQGHRIDDARFTLEQIDAVDPQPGEFEQLEEALPRSEHAELLSSAAYEAQKTLSGDSGVLDMLNGAIAELSHMGDVDSSLADIADSLSEAAIQLEDCSADLRTYRESIEFDPDELRRLQERYSALKGLLRQFGPTMDDVFKARDEAASLLAVVDHGEAHIKRTQAAWEEAEEKLSDAAKTLSDVRNTFGPRFCREVVKQMARLEMGHAELLWETQDLPRDSWTKDGSQTYELLYRSGAGLTPRPLRRIASGGELSRVMLASEVVLGEADGVDTLVFDEVDAGVGGSTARSLAAVIADLARTHQVIVVTHLAQVAVMGDKHYVVSKSEGDVPVTRLEEVAGDARVKEIARMLSGDLSELSCEHAAQMLRAAGASV